MASKVEMMKREKIMERKETLGAEDKMMKEKNLRTMMKKRRWATQD